MKTIVKSIRRIALENVAALEKIDRKIAEMQKATETYSASYISEKGASVKAERAAALDTANKEIDRIMSAYRDELSTRYRPDGDALTADAKLLASGIQLNETDTKRLFDLYNVAPCVRICTKT